jgi:hypothetical protein
MYLTWIIPVLYAAKPQIYILPEFNVVHNLLTLVGLGPKYLQIMEKYIVL